MASEFNFSELRNYLQGQADLGAGLDEFYLDEPWTLSPSLKPSVVPVRPVVVTPAMPFSATSAIGTAPSPSVAKPLASAQVNVPAPRVAKRSSAVYENAGSLEEFYTQIKSDVVYSKDPNVVRYIGPEHPKLLFLLPAVRPDQNSAEFFTSPVGEMLIRLFANLNITAGEMGVTYFLKVQNRPVPPLMETALKKMLVKELSFINPQIMVSCGEPLFHQLFGRARKFDELAGMDMDFSGFKTCALVDPFAMINDKQMKWLTWKVHIPRSAFFSAK